MQSSDRILVEAHLAGDPEAFAAIVRRHGPPVYGYLVKMVRDTHKADDLFQETFQKVCWKAADFRGQELKPWIFAIAATTAINSFRKRPAPSSLDGYACEDGSHCPPQALISSTRDNPANLTVLKEKRLQVQAALLKLPEKQRTTVILSYYQKMSYSQIAETLGCSLGTVKTTMFRALKRLAGLLPEPGDSE